MYIAFTTVQRVKSFKAVFQSMTRKLFYSFCLKKERHVKFLILSVKIASGLVISAGLKYKTIPFECKSVHLLRESHKVFKNIDNTLVRELRSVTHLKCYETGVSNAVLDHNTSGQKKCSILQAEYRLFSTSHDTYIPDEVVLEEPSQILNSGTLPNHKEDIGVTVVKELSLETNQQPIPDISVPPLKSGNKGCVDTSKGSVPVLNRGVESHGNTEFSNMEYKSIRWMFDIGSWHPSEEDWVLALSSVQAEECDRICRFVFRKDARASLAGRLLARLFVSHALSLPWCEISLKRDARGKPIVREGLTDAKVNFSISHAGRWCVLAGEAGYDSSVADAVGVDVVEEKHSDAIRLLHMMQRNLSPSEQCLIKNCGEAAPAVFFRLWALKESYLKATGEGIGGGPALCDLSFSLCNINLPTTSGIVDVSTSLEVKGNPLPSGWHFEESRIDESHIVAVAVSGSESNCYKMKSDPPVFQKVSWAELQPYLQCLTHKAQQIYVDYFTKPESPSYLQSKHK